MTPQCVIRYSLSGGLFHDFYVQVSLDVLISLIMLLVVLRQKGMPAALSNRAERSNSVKYAIKVKYEMDGQ